MQRRERDSCAPRRRKTLHSGPLGPEGGASKASSGSQSRAREGRGGAPPRLRPSLAALAAFLGCVLSWTLSACDRDESTAPSEAISLALSQYFPVAQVSGEIERRSAASSAPPEALRMQPGSQLRFHFMLPAEASLAGEWELEGDGGKPQLLLAIQGQSDAAPRVVDLISAESSPAGAARFREDLSELAGQMAGLSFTNAGDATLSLRGLRLEGSRVAEMPAKLVRRPYNVLIVLLDSLRQDAIEPYGAEQARTPQLRRLAESGTTFANARSNASWTRPSVASMMTSLFPPAHGILSLNDRLPETVPYLPAILKKVGYRTLAISNSPVVSSSHALDRGYDEMIELWREKDQWEAHAREPEAHAKFVWSTYLRNVVRDDKPFFIYLHEIDPHIPYDPPSPYRELYAFDYSGRVEGTRFGIGHMRKRPDKVNPQDVRHIRSLYRGEVAYMDRYVGWIIDRLESTELSRPTLIVFTSDHGEEFWDHESVGHGQSVFEELIRVPLIMKLEGVLPEGRRIDANVSLADLAPTLLDLLGLEIPSAMQGQSLLPLLDATDDDPLVRGSIARSHVPSLESLTFGRWKLVRNLDNPNSQVALYDLEADPRERSDRSGNEPVVTATLLQQLDWNLYRSAQEWGHSALEVGSGDLDPLMLENLRELGYIE